MTNVTVFGTRSGFLRATVRRSNYPQVEVTIGSPAFMALPQEVRDLVREKSILFLESLRRNFTENFRDNEIAIRCQHLGIDYKLKTELN